MNQFLARRGGDRVRGGGFAGLRQLLAERRLGAMQRLRQPIGDRIRQGFPNQDVAP